MAVYPQYYQPQQMSPTMMSGSMQPTQISPAQQNGGIIWVQGEAAAKSYLVAPGNTVQLWDSEAQVIYLKTADIYGIPSMKVIDYTLRDESTPVPANVEEYATKEDVLELRKQIDAISKKLPKTTREVKTNE